MEEVTRSKCPNLATPMEEEPEDWLLGDLVHSLQTKQGSKLPTNGEVLRHYLFLARTEMCYNTKPEVIFKVLKKVVSFWDYAEIKTQDIFKNKRPKNKFEKLINEYEYFSKNKKKPPPNWDQRKEELLENLNKLFDIASADAEEVIRKDYLRTKEEKEEDLKFLIDQRSERMYELGATDTQYIAKVSGNSERKIRIKGYLEKKREQNRSRSSLQFSEHDEEKEPQPSTSKCNETEYIPHSRMQQSGKKRRIFEDCQITSMADRYKMSVRERTGFAAAIAINCGVDLKNVALSKSTAQRCSTKNRTEVSKAIRKIFIVPSLSIIHWDGKLVHMDSTTNEERLSIIISGYPTAIEGKVLCIPSIKDSTGIEQGLTAYQAVCDWNAEKYIWGEVFDTTASNTGWMNGACKILEEQLCRKIMWCACRHHVYERFLSAAYIEIFGSTTGPENKYFKEFRQAWPNLDKTKFKIYSTENRKLKSKVHTVIDNLESILQNSIFIREDYRQSAEVILQVLVGSSNAVKWYKPGAFHHARWMANLIYNAKMYAFSEQMRYSKQFVDKLEVFFIFTVFYILPWLNAPSAPDASFNDLQFFKDIHLFGETINKKLAVRVHEIFQNQFWYLTEELVPFSLFSNKISNEEKKIIANQIVKYHKNDQSNKFKSPGKPIFPLCKINTNLVSLIGPSSFLIFSFTDNDANMNWLSQPVSSWDKNDNFNELATAIRNLKVVNDCAERGVKLIEDYAKCITKNENSRQDLLQLVEKERKELKNVNKLSLINHLS